MCYVWLNLYWSVHVLTVWLLHSWVQECSCNCCHHMYNFYQYLFMFLCWKGGTSAKKNKPFTSRCNSFFHLAVNQTTTVFAIHLLKHPNELWPTFVLLAVWWSRFVWIQRFRRIWQILTNLCLILSSVRFARICEHSWGSISLNVVFSMKSFMWCIIIQLYVM